MAQTYGQCQYEVSAIIQGPPCPFTGPPDTFPLGMNSHGDVVGYYWHCEGPTVSTFAFFRAGDTGEFITLPTPEWALSSRANDINDNRVIVGSHRLPSGIEWRAFVYDLEKQEYTILEPKHGVGTSHGNAINNNNVVAGARSIGEPGQSPNPFNAVIWDTNTGEVIDLGVMNGPHSVAEDINSIGNVAGWSGSSVISPNAKAWIWVDAAPIPLGLLPGTVQCTARGINDSHEVIGSCRTPEGPFISFYWANGKMSQFAPPEGFSNAGPADISNIGQIVGGKLPITGSPHHAYLWQHEEFHNLNALAVDPVENLHLTGGRVAKDNGLILAGGSLGNKTVGAVLTPIDVPFADFNFDCKVDVHDLVELILNWGPNPGSKYDLTGNGVVNVFDLLTLLANWG